MENNEIKTAEETAQTNTGSTEPQIDYKTEYEKMKKLKDQYSQESADWKKKYNSTLSDVEQQRLANEEKEARYKEIERQYNLSNITSKLSKTIGDDKVVGDIADKLLEGSTLEAIDILNTYLATRDELVKKQVTETLLKDNPTPPPSNSTGLTKEQFDAMGYDERVNLLRTDPETYKKFNN